MGRLSERMRRTLVALRDKGELSAYDYGVTIGTMEALQRRGFVTARYGFGSMFCLAVNIKWSITPAGRQALANAGETGRG